MVIVFEFLEFY